MINDKKINEIKNKLESFRRKLAIDINTLQDESASFPSFCDEVNSFIAETSYFIENAELELETHIDKISLLIRKDPKKYGLEKPTESAIKSTVNTRSSVLSMKKEILELKKVVDEAKGLQRSVDSKRSMIKVEAQLHASNYFALTSVKVVSKESRKEYENEIVGKRKKRNV